MEERTVTISLEEYRMMLEYKVRNEQLFFHKNEIMQKLNELQKQITELREKQ